MATEKKDAKEKKPAEAKSEEAKPAVKTKAAKPSKEEKGLLAATAEAIGSAIGTIAATTGIAHAPKPSTPSSKIPKLAKKEKHRLPRKEKKRAAKLAAAKGKPKPGKQAAGVVSK